MLDKEFQPMYLYYTEFCKGVSSSEGKPFFFALERSGGVVKTFKMSIYKDGARHPQNLRMAERIAKFMLWSFGGFRFTLYGDRRICDELREIYSPRGERAFDAEFMEKVYLRPLEFVCADDLGAFPAEKEAPVYPSRNASGKRIGFDAGGSDRKVTACVDGRAVFENETVWNPKLNADPAYHEQGIADSVEKALAALGGKTDSIGVSTAGIVIENEVRVASLFRLVPEEIYAERIRPIYKNLAQKYGCPVTVANDGDVAALAGAYQTGRGELLGTAMGTSLAAGYIDGKMGIDGYLNELAFVPVDANPCAAADEWSGDKGVGSVYHSQDGVIRLAAEAGIDLTEFVTPAEKLKAVQKRAEQGDPAAEEIFGRMGDYYGYSLLWFSVFYKIKDVILLGRVASGKGGERLLAHAQAVLKEYGSEIRIVLPDEMSRRLGQSFTAATL